MAFKAPMAFARPASRNNGKTFTKKPSVYDHLVTIEEIDPIKNHLIGTNNMGKRAMYFINTEAMARQDRSTVNNKDLKWVGHRINADMKKELPVGHRVIMERTTFKSYIDSADGKMPVYESTKVINSTVQTPEKLFTGIFTAREGFGTDAGRAGWIYSWDKTGIDVNDTAAIDALGAKLDAQLAVQESGAHFQPLGFLLRFMRPVEDKFEVIESSHAMDYIPKQKDDSGNVISKARGLGSNDLTASIDAFKSYIATAHPGITSGVIDVCVFTNYKAGKYAKTLVIPEQSWKPITKLCRSEYKLSADGDAFVGQLHGAVGIMQLTEDAFDFKTKQLQVRNFAAALHINGYNADVRALVLAPNGSKTKLADGLKIKVEWNNAVPAIQEIPDLTTAELPSKPAASVADWDESIFEDDADIFGDAK